ncbi:MAG: 5'/3'-nucleotidase SurE [Aestuariivirgaceae bacterium]
MRILVSNDDGRNAPGLEVLEQIAGQLSDDVWVVAPETEQSGASHSISLSDPLRLHEHSARRYSVQGSPADCVLMAVRKIMPDVPDLLLSGVNRGQNIADDVTYSGTIAAAMEGTALGIKSMALSQSYGIESGKELRWDVGRDHGADIVERLMPLDLGPGVLLNINFPDCMPEEVTGIAVTRQGKRDQNMLIVDERVDARGRNYYWLGFRREMSKPADGTDLKAVYSRQISVTPLHMNLTQIEAMEALRAALD